MAISECAVTPPPLPCFTVIPIACVLFTQTLGVIVRDEERACRISSSHAVSSKSGFSAISHWRKNSNVFLLRIQLWITYPGDSSEYSLAS